MVQLSHGRPRPVAWENTAGGPGLYGLYGLTGAVRADISSVPGRKVSSVLGLPCDQAKAVLWLQTEI